MRLGRSWRTTIEDVVAFEERYTTKVVARIENRLPAGSVPKPPMSRMAVARQVQKMLRKRKVDRQ